ncbi:hypothetical protein M408DRAFT_196838 [Serendipita vermifera MAFF 305830]|uniref:Dynamin-type G domain-containing protein n=1 Tax=Serendipita vermifera MAFF 305830 TaxID=933852 RepID=A0A0C2WIH0_SERVB|nr:hypothetical protein M408DRAFT_196838 [Serendipita vermifera MAFF 305830]
MYEPTNMYSYLCLDVHKGLPSDMAGASQAADQNSPTIDESEYLNHPLVPRESGFGYLDSMQGTNLNWMTMTEPEAAGRSNPIIYDDLYLKRFSGPTELGFQNFKSIYNTVGTTWPTEATGSFVHFLKEPTKPLVPFMTTLHLRAQQLIHLARRVHVFHAQSSYIARQALHLVILLNDLVDAENGPDIEQREGRNDLEDDLTELYEAMAKWGAQTSDNEQVDYAQDRLRIKEQYSKLFKERFYFLACNSSADLVYKRSVAYDERTIQFRHPQHGVGMIVHGVDNWLAPDPTIPTFTSASPIMFVNKTTHHTTVSAIAHSDDPNSSGSQESTASEVSFGSFESFESFRPEGHSVDVDFKRLELKRIIDASVAAGASSHISIPQVVVLGSQSSGKSSLFEGISEVPLPRSSGTCTRCPLVCHMENNPGPWRCRVSIMREVDGNGDRLPETQTIPFGTEINSRDLVCERIQRAQMAILHPDKDPQQFIQGPLLGSPSGFSLNSIVINIEGPDVIDLSFVDLPGIIEDDGAKNDNVERVEKMAIKYIEQDCNLILLVFHCIDDIQNQSARRLARRYDPESKRTITVLTKLDWIEPIQAEPWQEMFRDSEDWFCVRQPGPAQLRYLSWKEAREQEMWFFQQYPWNNEYNDPLLRRRLGTESLTRYLNQRLLDWIVDKLPAMQDDLRRHLRDIKDTLDRLPARVENPIKRANELVWEFNELLRGAIRLDNFKIPHLVGTCRRSLEHFVNVIVYHLFPRFCPIPGPQGTNDSRVPFKDFPKELPVPTLPPSVTIVAVPKTVYLDEIVQQCEMGRTLEMPGNYPYGVQKKILENCVEMWREQAELMLDDVSQSMSNHLRNLVLKQFELSGRAETIWYVVYMRLLSVELTSVHRRSVVEAHIEVRRDTVREAIKASLEREKKCSLVYTCPEYFHYRKIYGDHYRSTILAKCRASTGEIIHKVANVVHDSFIPTAGHIVAEVVDGLAADEDTERSGLTDEQEHGIRVMAESRAFYHIAARRFAEGTAQIVFHDLLLDLQGGPELEQKLRERIGMSGPEAERRCRDFVEPSRAAIRTRDEFRRKQDVLKDVLHRLVHFS